MGSFLQLLKRESFRKTHKRLTVTAKRNEASVYLHLRLDAAPWRGQLHAPATRQHPRDIHGGSVPPSQRYMLTIHLLTKHRIN